MGKFESLQIITDQFQEKAQTNEKIVITKRKFTQEV